MKRRPYFKLWVDDFDLDERARSLSLELQGVYLWLLRHQWREGSIPADTERILRLLPVRSKGESSRLREGLPEVLACFGPADGDPSRLVNARLEAERKDAERSGEAQRMRGQLSAIARQRGRASSGMSQVEFEVRRQQLLSRLRSHLPGQPSAGSSLDEPAFNGGSTVVEQWLSGGGANAQPNGNRMPTNHHSIRDDDIDHPRIQDGRGRGKRPGGQVGKEGRRRVGRGNGA